MATSSLSTLGLGSDGALSYDTIDQLRAVDEAAILTPIDTKLTTNKNKQTELSSITTLANMLKSSTSSLADEVNYLQRTTTVSNDAISVTTQAGTTIDNFTMHVDTLAKQDIYQSSNFATQTSTFTASDDTLRLQLGSNTYDIDVTATTSLTDLKDMINEKADGKITASILNVGGANPYRLILKSNETGADNAITLSSTGSGTALTDLGLDLGANHLQTATDASFVYNGVTINRSTNNITDLIVGVNITLNKEQDATTNSTVSIAQDWSNITTNLQSLVSSYNDLISELKTATAYDTTSLKAGAFQGVSQINTLSNDIRKQVLSVDAEGRGLSSYGISLNSEGLLQFDSTVFDAKVKADPADVQDYFQGSTTYSATSHSGTAVSAGALTIGADEFKINGTSIAFTTPLTSTVEENLAAIQTAIKNAGLSNISVSLGSNDNIVLKSSIGENIVITGNTTALSSLGLQETSVYTTPTIKDGFFTTFNNTLKNYLNTTDGILTQFNKSLATEATSLTKSRATAVTRLDVKYEQMATKFAAYDSIINQLNAEFSSLQTIIKQSYSTDS